MISLIFKGQFQSIKEIMGKSRELGMCTFDQALFTLYNQRHISYEEAIRNADSANELRLQIKLKSSRGEAGNGAGSGGFSLSMKEEKKPEAEEAKAKQ